MRSTKSWRAEIDGKRFTDRDWSRFLSYLAEGGERYRLKVHRYVMIENIFIWVEEGLIGEIEDRSKR
jgi:hypothetical protein